MKKVNLRCYQQARCHPKRRKRKTYCLKRLLSPWAKGSLASSSRSRDTKSSTNWFDSAEVISSQVKTDEGTSGCVSGGFFQLSHFRGGTVSTSRLKLEMKNGRKKRFRINEEEAEMQLKQTYSSPRARWRRRTWRDWSCCCCCMFTI